MTLAMQTNFINALSLLIKRLSMSHLDGMLLEQGKTFQSGLTIYKKFSIKFEVLLTEFNNNRFSNIIHFTNGTSLKGKYGDRIPAVWSKGTGDPNYRQLYFAMALGQDENKVFSTVKSYSMHQWLCVEIRQVLSNGKYMFEIAVDSEVVHSVENTNPVDFHNVTVYISNPNSNLQEGRIRNIKLMTGNYNELHLYHIHFKYRLLLN